MRRIDMEFSQIRYFVVLAQQLCFTGTAAVCNV
jgi:DNA-binding transcriptional LysR family regulator